MKSCNIKIISMVALVLAIAGMTLGFAAFSATLNITSSATVTPNSADFKLMIYGYGGGTCTDSMGYENCLTDSTKSHPYYAKYPASIASIDNSVGLISGIELSMNDFTMDSNIGEFIYYFKLQNEGKYTIYLNSVNPYPYNDVSKICTAVGDTSQFLVDQACENITMSVDLIKLVNNRPQSVSNYEIEPGDFLIVKLTYTNNHKNGGWSDGQFEVKFSDLKVNYSTAK